MPQDHNDIEIRNLLFKKLSLKRRNNISLRMAPMIDMIFLLLIFFLVTAKFRPQEDLLPIKLPAPSKSVSSVAAPLVEPLVIRLRDTNDSLIIEIGNSKTLKIANDDIEKGLVTFSNDMLALYKAQKRTTADPVELDCDSDLSWSHLVKVYNILFGMGVTDITFPLED